MSSGADLVEIAPRLEVANVVVTSESLRPSDVNHFWLVSNGILARDQELPAGNLFADAAVHVQTDQFTLTVLKSTLQFAPTVPPRAEVALLRDKLGVLLRRLGLTTFGGYALNFCWFYYPAGNDNLGWTQRAFGRTDRVPFSLFATPDARYGAYMSMGVSADADADADALRMKLDIKPVGKTVDGVTRCAVEFAFNCERSFEPGHPDPVADVLASLGRWDGLKDRARSVVEQTVGAYR